MASVTEAMKDFAKNEVGNVTELGREIAANPKNVGTMIMDFFKSLWERLNAAGLVEMIVLKAKELFGMATSAASNARDEALPLVQNARDKIGAVAGSAAPQS